MGFLHSWPLYQWFITPCYSMVVSDYNYIIRRSIEPGIYCTCLIQSRPCQNILILFHDINLEFQTSFLSVNENLSATNGRDYFYGWEAVFNIKEYRVWLGYFAMLQGRLKQAGVLYTLVYYTIQYSPHSIHMCRKQAKRKRGILSS